MPINLLCEEEVDLDEDFLTESLFADFKDYLRSEWMKVPEFISKSIEELVNAHPTN